MYERMVSEVLASKALEAQTFLQTYYAQAPLYCVPSEYATTSKSKVVTQFHLLTPNVRWFEPDSGQQIPLYLNDDGAPVSGTSDDVNAPRGSPPQALSSLYPLSPAHPPAPLPPVSLPSSIIATESLPPPQAVQLSLE